MAAVAAAVAAASSSGPQAPAPRTFTQSVSQYRRWFHSTDEQDQDGAAEAQREQRKENASAIADEYYDFATQAFLSNWSPSFHYTPFSPQHQTLREAQTFYQHRLAVFLQLQPTDLVLDVGCGVGGPALEIARLVGCTVVGVSINQRQIDIARAEARRQGLGDGDGDDHDHDNTNSGCTRGHCTFVRADFSHLPFPDNTFDAAFAIEATCHAANLTAVYREIARVVKKDGKGKYHHHHHHHSSSSSRRRCAISEWVLTPAFDAANAQHVRVRERIERGNGVASLPTSTQAHDAFRAAGFRIVHSEDFARHFDYACQQQQQQQQQQQPADLLLGKSSSSSLSSQKPRPWYRPLDGTLSFLTSSSSLADVWRTVKLHSLVYRVSYAVVWLLQAVGMYPPGVTEAMETMKDAVDGVREGGELGILSPAWWMVGAWAEEEEDEEDEEDEGDEEVEGGNAC